MFILAEKKLISGWRSIRVDSRTGRRFWHKAGDYEAYFVHLFMSFDGIARSRGANNKRTQGGLWIDMVNDQVKVQTAHNSQFLVPQGSFQKEGAIIGITGDSGYLSSGPHNHTQIINRLTGERVDPELFDWFDYRIRKNMFIKAQSSAEVSMLMPDNTRRAITGKAYKKLGEPKVIEYSDAQYNQFPVVDVIEDVILRKK